MRSVDTSPRLYVQLHIGSSLREVEVVVVVFVVVIAVGNSHIAGWNVEMVRWLWRAAVSTPSNSIDVPPVREGRLRGNACCLLWDLVINRSNDSSLPFH